MSQSLFFLFFCVLAIVLVATAIGLNFMEAQRRKQVRQILRTVEGKPAEQKVANILNETGENVRSVGARDLAFALGAAGRRNAAAVRFELVA